MIESIYLLAGLFALLLLLNVPVSISVALATLVSLMLSMDSAPATTTVAQRMVGGLDSFTLLAIPFFILSGQIMGSGGIALRLVEAAKVLVGRLPGGLAFVNIVSNTLFGSISGSAVASTSAIGSFMIPEMKRAGYQPAFGGAVTAASSITGLLIPPSNSLIVYAVASGGVSISALFVAGYVPGILLALTLMLMCGILALRNNMPRAESLPLRSALKKLLQALPSLTLLIIVIGGILGGIFTATEAGAIAVMYALALSMLFYRELSVQQLPSVLLKAAETTAVVMLLIATSTALGWLLAYASIPQLVSDAMLTLSENPLLILLLMNLILLIVGAFLDLTPAVLIFTPIFLPVATQLGISPLHFGIMLIMNLSIGLCTPPVGSVLFVGCAVAKSSIAQTIRAMWPLYFAMLAVLLLTIFVPAVSETLPRAFGLID